MSNLSAPHFHNEKAAFAYIEARVWPKGVVCPKCGCTGRISELKGSSTRIGVKKCYDCKAQFTVKVGTIFQASHIELRVWLQAMYLLCSSKKGISSNQLARTLGITLKSAWFLSHRIRAAMADGGLDKLGGAGGIVEVDEVFYGTDPNRAPKTKNRRSPNMNKLLTIVDRDRSVVRSLDRKRV